MFIKTAQLPTQSKLLTPASMLTPFQLRAARALIGWSRQDLSKGSGVAVNTTKDFEINGSDPKLGTVQKWRRALEAAGVEFIDPSDDKGPGVRLRGQHKEKRR